MIKTFSMWVMAAHNCLLFDLGVPRLKSSVMYDNEISQAAYITHQSRSTWAIGLCFLISV